MKSLNEWMKNDRSLNEGMNDPNIDNMIEIVKEIQKFFSEYASYLQGLKSGKKAKPRAQMLIKIGQGIKEVLPAIDNAVAYATDPEEFKAFYKDCNKAMLSLRALLGKL